MRKIRKHMRFKTINVITVVIGTFVIVLGLTADWLGISNPTTFGIGQIVVIILGFVVLLFAFQPKIISSTYNYVIRKWLTVINKIAVLFLSIFIVLVVLEIGCTILIKRPVLFSSDNRMLDLPYYRSKDWSKTYWREHFEVFAGQRIYSPYVIWRTAPFEGETININERGIRRTIGVKDSCDIESYDVFAFGGSTMIGFGSPDWGTIPSYLQEYLSKTLDEPVCVTNFGDIGYISSQCVIMLYKQIIEGNVPDIVIFYNGLNDSIVSYYDKTVGVHTGVNSIRIKLETPFKGILVHSNLAQFLLPKLHKIFRVANLYNYTNNHADDLASQAAETYLNNFNVVQSLASKYDFKVFFFFEPFIKLSEKTLTIEEKKAIQTMDYSMPGFAKFMSEIYSFIESKSSGYKNMHFLNNIFDDLNEQIWIDFAHITPEGNKIISKMISYIISQKITMENLFLQNQKNT